MSSSEARPGRQALQLRCFKMLLEAASPSRSSPTCCVKRRKQGLPQRGCRQAPQGWQPQVVAGDDGKGKGQALQAGLRQHRGSSAPNGLIQAGAGLCQAPQAGLPQGGPQTPQAGLPQVGPSSAASRAASTSTSRVKRRKEGGCLKSCKTSCVNLKEWAVRIVKRCKLSCVNSNVKGQSPEAGAASRGADVKRCKLSRVNFNLNLKASRVKRRKRGCSKSLQEALEGGRAPALVRCPSGRGPLRGPRDKYPRAAQREREGKPTRAEFA
ncbi:uncharacterized protein B0H18DRAFT_1156652 [Fomitopsis serialis]|uniref:uncharacterized protein n=1 Tax=Fomitopsis serialis TaxID=139415 RepID=UPI00200844CC|nr:uncharacterized protein B0H18DRAFT_1156652 [Neoantrodia serialis]KAH9928675.1 hypothetical protein B0H18DRAFT_1156652 [Neoantrodia serialis]